MSTMPTWEDFMVPVLTLMSDGRERSLRALREAVVESVGLTQDQQSITLPSGQSQAQNRVGWATSYLQRVDALLRPRRGFYVITDKGRQLLATHPTGITEAHLREIAREGDQWWSGNTASSSTTAEPMPGETALDPTEQVEQGIARIHADVAAELLARLSEQDSAFFEHAVVRLLLAMGYGGVGGQGLTTSKSNDGGIDGVIDQDVLGLSKVYIQAKRYAQGNAVQRPEVQGFVGALSGKADSGVFFTTSRFSAGAIEWADRVPARIILVDGQQLATLMIKYNVGVQVKDTYAVVEVDEDFFA